MTKEELKVIKKAKEFVRAYIRYGKELDKEMEALCDAVIELYPAMSKEGQ